ncbi:hypothetical protein VTJ83DRAFT_3582 [Remersonia thermophila]|uniref:Transaldolase n=1 Tax=Remersonia thermophila TaxID=72144 RepID=A0ABR4DEI5_9PEZI
MVVESKRRPPPPLPVPTETNSTLTGAPSDVTSEISKSGDEKSSYSLPDDGTPVVIRTGGHRSTKSQTSLLIEYWEGGRASHTSAASDSRKPSVRVRVTPGSKNRSRSSSERDRIRISQSRSRKNSPSRRSGSKVGPTRSEIEALEDMETSSYASATEESTVSRNPIEVEIERGGNARRRRPASPLIPATDSKVSYQNATGSEISAIPTNSFLDGSGPATSFGMSETKSDPSRDPSRDYAAGAAAGLGAAAAADKLRSKTRESRERDSVVVSKTRDREKDRERDRERDRRHRPSKSRTSSLSKEDKYSERAKSPRRRSKGHTDSVVSAADSSVVSSAFAPTHRSMDQHSVRSAASKASSINNPKLLETVEDAIRRLILPELNALKREQSKHKTRRDSVTSSTTTASKDDYASERRRSGVTDKGPFTPRDSMRSKASRDREARNDFDDSSAISHDSIDDDRDYDDTPVHSADRLKASGAGAAMGAATAAIHGLLQSPSDDKQRARRRRRAEMRARGSEITADEDSELGPPSVPMPLMSDVNASDVTRASILSAETDRPHSASEELDPSRDRENERPSRSSTPTPTRHLLQALGTLHANVSHGDLKKLPEQRTGQWDEYIIDDNGKKVPSRMARRLRGEEDDDYEDSESGQPFAADNPYDYYSTQDVPPPLKYVPYQPERRGLSPIPSVSGYTEGSDVAARESRATHRASDSNLGDDRSVRSSVLDQASVISPPGSELDAITSGQAVHAVALNPDIIHPPGIESNVASLVDASMIDGSVLTNSSSAVGHQYVPREAMSTLEEEHPREPGTPSKRSVGSRHDEVDSRGVSPESDGHRSRQFVEYDLDEYGRKVPKTTYRQSPTVSEAAITSAAVGAAAAVLRAQNAKGQQAVAADDQIDYQGAGAEQGMSFKDRTQNGRRPGIDTASQQSLASEANRPKMGFSSMPDPNDPMPEIGQWNDDDFDMLTNPSLLNGESGRDGDDHWEGDATPRQHPQNPQDEVDYQDLDGARASQATPQQRGNLAAADNEGQDQDEWYRSPEDRKRDTLVTNPYEGSSPIANGTLLAGQGFDPAAFDGLYGTRSPLGHKVDEGYISQGPNKTPDMHAKGKSPDYGLVGPGPEDPFFTSQTRHLSGMSQGMGTPMYDAATGAGIENIESKDIIALMQHLMVRDAQRSARDTEILVTLVRAATEMRNNFEDIKRLLADTEDVIITEVKENTDKTVQRAINGPRPYPGSTRHSIHVASQAGSVNGDDLAAKKRSLFRRALKGLSAKGANDLSRIEDMLNQLLTEVDTLKAQTAPGHHLGQVNPSYDNIQPEIQDEQDHGYEPEGMAGTSTASHASQSGYLSLQSRGASTKPVYDRKPSAHRISTVPEDNEEEYDHGRKHDTPQLMTPGRDQAAGSMPLDTPVGPPSNENTPGTGESKKKSRSSWFRIPKISRWSETTASSAMSHGKQSSKDETANFAAGPSRSGSLDHYGENYPYSTQQPIQTDKLHTGFSETELPQGYQQDDGAENMYEQMATPNLPQPDPNWVSMSMTPEDPKYKAHRDSMNLVHPQPRQGQTERFKAALESQALGFDQPLSPQSATDWQGSTTSLSRFVQNMDGYGSDAQYHQQPWSSSPAPAPLNINSATGSTDIPPPRPPKEALDAPSSPLPQQQQPQVSTPPPQHKRVSKLQKKHGSPLPHQSVESGYGTMTYGVPTASYVSQRDSNDGGSSSPRLENRNLSGALQAGVSRRPSGPRPMTPTGKGAGPSALGRSSESAVEGERKRDTFGSVASQESLTF